MSLRLLFSLVMLCFVLPALVGHSSAAAEAGDAAQRYVPLLKDPDALVRKRAALALKRMGAKAKSAVPALEEALTDPAAEVRAAVAAALEAIDPVPRPAEVKPAPAPPGQAATPPIEKPHTAPIAERVEVGSYFFGPRSPVSILMARKKAGDAWHRLKANDPIFTSDELVSLPGYLSEVHLNSGVRLLLRGHVRDFSLFPDMDHLEASAIVLHKSSDMDADLTLRGGRLYFANNKKRGSAVVRLRFDKEVWDVTLQEPGAEVVVDLLRRYRGDVDYLKGEEPLVSLHLFVLHGKAGLAAGYHHYPELSEPPGPAYFLWENRGGGLRGPIKHDKPPDFFAKVLPVDPKNETAEKMVNALKTLSLRLLPPKDPLMVLADVLQQKSDPAQRMLAIYCLGALDDANELLTILGDSDPAHALDRNTAIFALRRWLERDTRRGAELFDPNTKTGLLVVRQKYRPADAARIFVLLHDFSEDEIFAAETYEQLASNLISDKVALAELARWHLYRLARFQGVSLPALDKFNAALPRNERQAAFREVRDKIEKGELPARGPLPKPTENQRRPE